MKIVSKVSKKQLLSTLNELYNLIKITSGYKYEGLAFNTRTESYWVIYINKHNFSRVCRLIAPYNSLECHIICRLPTGIDAFNFKDDFILDRFNNFIEFLKSIPCIKVIPDRYLKYTYYIQLEDL